MVLGVVELRVILNILVSSKPSMRLTQKEWQIIEAFIRGKDVTVVSFLPYQTDAIDFVQNWKTPPPKKIGIFTMKAQYKGRKKPLFYVLDEDKEDD